MSHTISQVSTDKKKNQLQIDFFLQDGLFVPYNEHIAPQTLNRQQKQFPFG